MSWRKRAIKTVERLTDTHIVRRHRRGIDFVQDIAFSLPKCHIESVFDIGANVGQSARVFLDEFPLAHIRCFEPVSKAFNELKQTFQGNARVDCYQLAFGATKGRGRMVLAGTSDISFLDGQSRDNATSAELDIDSVDVDTIDGYCRTNEVPHINFLKIDTEGGDLDVLKGSVGMLGDQRIDLVQVEAGMNPHTNCFVPFEALKAFLESHGYRLFGIYEQKHEFITGEAHLRRTNPVFVSQQVIEANTQLSRLGS
ncbi:MAG: FkbM family methyltransferase [Chthoniobacterales bacterium]|nr:FkbM family methyltransferase [Chthoniobacterales bacterium]